MSVSCAQDNPSTNFPVHSHLSQSIWPADLLVLAGLCPTVNGWKDEYLAAAQSEQVLCRNSTGSECPGMFLLGIFFLDRDADAVPSAVHRAVEDCQPPSTITAEWR